MKRKTVHVGRIGNRITLSPEGIITLRRRHYPADGARATVSDFASGLLGRKHTTTLTITLANEEIIVWQETSTGSYARLSHNMAVALAAAVNSRSAR